MGKRIEKMRAKLFLALVGRFSGSKVVNFTRRAGFRGRPAVFFSLLRRQNRKRKEGRGR